jgi:hypothetical protein
MLNSGDGLAGPRTTSLGNDDFFDSRGRSRAQPKSAKAGCVPGPIARLRSVATGMCVSGALLPLPFIAAGRSVGTWEWMGIGFAWTFLLPAGGVLLLICVAVNRTRAELRALLLGAAAITAGIALLPTAARVGTEAYVSSHSGEMDEMAAWGRQHWTWAIGGPFDAYPEGEHSVSRMTGHRVWPQFMDGGIAFVSETLFDGDLFYADGVKSTTPFTCRDLRAIGGRWYLADCSAGDAEYVAGPPVRSGDGAPHLITCDTGDGSVALRSAMTQVAAWPALRVTS